MKRIRIHKIEIYTFTSVSMITNSANIFLDRISKAYSGCDLEVKIETAVSSNNADALILITIHYSYMEEQE